ncbi:hypothetical protein CFC21_017762 [Triticum aestivum]|uniref:Uncharacterized protein n=3 Tax=Triticum TaxID=4564 RepID=A0A9R1NXK2_TRITD|nr:hypothetical protein CFC21_017762 [Triticum aestivum]VAH32955.1 unnamed protein product [Triticum turgidum subsp. durum]
MAETKLHDDVHFCNTSGLHFPLPWTYGYLIVKNKSRKYRHASSHGRKSNMKFLSASNCFHLYSAEFLPSMGLYMGIIYKGYVLCR